MLKPDNTIKLRDFTLLELIIAMTMMAVIMTFVTPQLSRFTRSRDVSNEVERLIAFSRYANSLAVSHGSDVGMIISPADGTISIEEQYGHFNEEIENDDETTAYRKIELSEGITLDINSEEIDENEDLLIVFHPDGFAEGAEQTIITVSNVYNDELFEQLWLSPIDGALKIVADEEEMEDILDDDEKTTTL